MKNLIALAAFALIAAGCASSDPDEASTPVKTVPAAQVEQSIPKDQITNDGKSAIIDPNNLPPDVK